MTKCGLITHSRTKRVTAGALADAKTRNDWSNGDMGDAMGCGEGTVRHRLNADDPSHQMTVHELLRLTQADGPRVANAIFADIQHALVPDVHDTVPDALAAASGAALCASALIEAAPGGIDLVEWRRLLPTLEAHDAVISRLIQIGRAALAEVR
ncbi:hypothetical protein HZY97_20310 [Sphingomonas sp. R-74633]|uniref:phage regulatory CII family protein n=1 Tax=Sphingomonas sp. R-74633 TaxID=2751188 RepID=UPI0015D2CCEB|nr:phage regulatory CII family protein [Sphingomonas sp. R-74633]NYT43130.1 hypothetical protein [Sphingomonas sp. R-74633]